MLPFLAGVRRLPTLEAPRDGFSDNGHIAEPPSLSQTYFANLKPTGGRTGWRRVYIACLTDR